MRAGPTSRPSTARSLTITPLEIFPNESNRRRLSARARALVSALALAAAFAPAAVHAEVYRWVDRDGVVHYTTDRDRIPRRFRGEASIVQRRPASPAPSIEREAAAPAEDAERLPSFGPETASSGIDRQHPASSGEAPPTDAPSARMPSATQPSAAPIRIGRPSDSLGPRSQEIAELEAQIEADREAVKQIISREDVEEGQLALDPQLQEIANRLPRLLSELDALRGEPGP
jgi:hypothetical protein